MTSPVPGDVRPEPVFYTCADCEKRWEQGVAVLGQHYVITRADGTVHCLSKPNCRGRQLTTRHGWDKRSWSRVAREYWLDQMDVPPAPANWKETGWTHKYSEVQRVEAAIHYLSLCWPACMPYACRLNADESDVLYDEYAPDGIAIAREKDLARLLKMKQPNVNRNIRKLRDQGKLSTENGYYELLPKPRELTIEERLHLNSIEAKAADMADFLRGVPKAKRDEVWRIFHALEGAENAGMDEDGNYPVPDGTAGQFCSAVADACGQYKRQLNGLRSDLNSTLEKTCTSTCILFPRILGSNTYVRQEQPLPEPDPVPCDPPSHDEGQVSPVNQQYGSVAETPAGDTEPEEPAESLRVAPFPYTEADDALFFSTVNAWQKASNDKVRFGKVPIQIERKGDRNFARGVFLRLMGYRFAGDGRTTMEVGSPEQASDLLDFLQTAYRAIFPDANSLGKAIQSIGILNSLAESYNDAHSGNRGESARLEAEERRRVDEGSRARAEVLAAENALHEAAERKWGELPEESRRTRLEMARQILKVESRWKNIPPEIREREAAAYALSRLKEEISQKAGGAHG